MAPSSIARVAGDRRAAGAVEHGQEGALGGERGRGVGVVDRGDAARGCGVVGARLDADRALADRGQKFVDVEQCRRRVGRPSRFKPASAEQRGIDLASSSLRKPRLDIAAQRHDARDRAAARLTIACRRSDEVPTTAPRRQLAQGLPPCG